MDRRQFVKCSITGGLVLATTPAIVVTGCSTGWIDVVLKDIPIVVNIVQSILSVITIATGTGLIASGVSAIITQAVTALAATLSALEDAINAYNSNKGTGLGAVIAALQAAQQDAKAVMAALPAGTLTATWQLVIIAGLGTVITILSAMESVIPGAATASIKAQIAAHVSTNGIVLPSTATIKAGFNYVLMVYGYEGAAIK